jgi:2-keto-4-pentenoate hydratase
MIARRVAAGERQIGWKVGLTAPAIQQQFGFHEPVFGCILDSRSSGHVFGHDELIRPGFEPELCLRVGQALSGEVDVSTVRRAIDAVYPALEIIETRGDLSAQIAVAMADNAQQKTVVLGDPVALGSLALDAVAATVRINGETAATGRGDVVPALQSAELGGLAGAKLAAFGRRAFRPGEIIAGGSFTRQFPSRRAIRWRWISPAWAGVRTEILG